MTTAAAAARVFLIQEAPYGGGKMTEQAPTPPPPSAPPQPQYAPVRHGPPPGTAGQAAAFWLGWLPLGILMTILLYFPVCIFIGVNARRLGYRAHDFLMVFIPYYGFYGFMPKMMWRWAHRKTPYWSYAP